MITLDFTPCDFRQVAPRTWKCPHCGAGYRGERKAIGRCKRPPGHAADYAPQPSSLSPQPSDHWQEWREQGGRWVAVGYLQPGYGADPPQFDPEPGEVLSTPAFPLEDFR